MKFRALSALILTLAMFATGFAQTLDKAKLDQFFDRLAEKDRAMGTLTISKEGKIIYSRTIGYSQIGATEKKPAGATTRYRVGSIAKMFTGTMIFQLVEEGKLKLTDTLDKFFPQVPNASKITIGHILAHRSGIHSFTNDKEFGTWMMNPKTPAELLEIIAKSTPDFEPDAKYNYSNAGYILLGFIVEKLTGKTYQQALTERITAKIGLKDTYLGTGTTDVSRNEAYSFRHDGGWKQATETHLSIPGGAGSIISTSADLTKFIEALFNLKLVSQSSLDQMMQKNMAMTTFPFDGSKPLYGHGGSIDGYNALLMYQPEEKLAVAYTSNAVVYSRNGIMGGIFDIYRNKPFEIPTFETVAVSPEVLDKYVGVYASPDMPVKMTITRNGSTLFAQPTGQTQLPLEAAAETRFLIEKAGMVMDFDPSKNQMTLKGGGRVTVFTKEK